ncbi:MAG: coniferyl aldehyde dehydrogenase [Legionellaceae bacterium]|nr:coniferyl aldehyde dehydrogenase [Legionellaceae bacterium]
MDTATLTQCFGQLQTQAQANLYVPVQQRIECLQALKCLLQDEADAVVEAVNRDFSWRAPKETALLELLPSIRAIDFCIKHCLSWSKPRKRKVGWLFQPAVAHLFPQPLGVVGIMVPWNYPVYLAIVPAAYAIAAGNQVLLKMSEASPALGSLLAEKMTPFSKRYHPSIQIINGDVNISKAFASLPFDHLLFTGSTAIGKQIMAAASTNLTPLTLELGGKSPAVISKTVRMNYVSRLFMGKCFNAGQTCVAPDYILVHHTLVAQVQQQALSFFRQSYPGNTADENYTGIVSEAHFARLQALLADAKAQGAELISLGERDPQERKIPLTLVCKVKPEMKIMQEEIFGPLLPLVAYEDFAEVIEFINERPKPLAVYYFGESKKEQARLQYETLSGALTINDSVTHVAIDDLPFGGVGASGMGCYHGQEGFDTFSQLKPIVKQGKFVSMSWLYPPYGRLLNLVLAVLAGIKLTHKK